MKIMFTTVFTGIMLSGCQAQNVNPQIDEAIVMQNTLAQNKALVTSFFKDFSSGNIDEAFALVSDEASWWVPGDLPFSGTKTKAEYLQVVSAIKAGFPNGLELKVTSILAEGDKVAVEVTSYGEHVNDKTYTNKYHFLITIEDGKLAEVKEYMDTLHLYQLIQP